ncbi:MAG: sialidase [Gemmatimonadales bacterium]
MIRPVCRTVSSLVVLFVALAAARPIEAQRRSAPAATPATAAAPAIDSTAWTALRWRHIGPEGNRVSAVAGVAGDPMTYYAGAASGGLWKTVDGGIHWAPIFDDQPVSSIGALAVAPSDPNVVWAGTGEPWVRSHISIGWGVYRSTDAGKSWKRMGLDSTGRIARIVVHPTDPKTVYVAAEGHLYAPQQQIGIYRTTDGGATWERVLFVNDSTGASDLVMDPNNPRILFAGFWQVQVRTWGRTSGGAGSGIWKSADGGTTWTRLKGNGLPTRPVGKVGLAMSRANSNRIYALIETGDGVPAVNIAQPDSGRLFCSDDGGSSWQLVSFDRQVAGRTHYYSRMGVMPDNADEAYFLAASWSKTLDGGRTIIDPPDSMVPGGDHHDIWIDPTNGNRMAVGHDIGISITQNRGRTWLRVQLPIAQMYHVTVDDRIPYYVYGNRQDGPSARGPSNSRTGDIARGQWVTVGGGESGFATPDPGDSNVVWSSASGYGAGGGIVTRLDLRSGVERNVEVWPLATVGSPASAVRYRFVWNFPLTFSPFDHNTLYVGSQFVHATGDGGVTWRTISPDLTRNDTTRERPSGGLTPDNIGVEYAGVVFSIAESRLKRGLIWAGTNDGLVQVTRDGGATWTDVTRNIRGLLDWGTISSVEPSRFDTGTAYVSVDGHQVGNFDPWIYKTTDYGATWTLITTGIPHTPLSYVHAVKEDPARRGLLYAGTENGMYVSLDDGAHWQTLQNNLPHAPVYGIVVQERFNDLVIATYGRGFWILDDVTPLRTLTPEVAARDAWLYAPRTAYRLRAVAGPFAPMDDPVVGTNPPDGASLTWWRRTASDSTHPDSQAIQILDANGRLVRTLKQVPKAGMNRIWWDLRTELTTEAKLRTSPPFAAWLAVKPEGTPAPGVGRFSPLAPPGRYTVRLTVGGQTLEQGLEVLQDPNTGASAEDLKAQTAFIVDLVADLDSTVAMINRLEILRGQLSALRATLTGDSSAADVRVAADSLDRTLLAVEDPLFQMKITGRGQDGLRWPMRLAERLLYLLRSATGSDFGPTASQREVAQLLAGQVRDARARFDSVMTGPVAEFRGLLRARNLPNVVF